MSNNIQRVTLKAIIKNEDRFLLLKDKKGVWELPGGKIDFGEAPDETIKRELSEELGIHNMSVRDLVDVWTFITSNGSDNFQFIVIVYEVGIDSKELKISDEHLEFSWILFSEIKDLNMKEGYKESIIKFKEKNAREV
jgi:8-oxo-dGTP diphosphatase